jgi:hypothetical protein
MFLGHRLRFDWRGFDCGPRSPIGVIDDAASERRTPDRHHCRHNTDED